MKIVVRCHDAAKLAQLVTALRELGHEVQAAPTVVQAITLIDAGFPDLVIAEPESPLEKGLDVFRHVRAAAHPMYAIALVGPISDPQLLHVYEAGADHHMPIHPSALQLRSRLIPALRCNPATLAALAAPALAAAAPEGPVTLVGGKAWRAMAAEIETMIARFLVMKVATKEVDPRSTTIDVAAGIVLANAARECEVRIALGADAASARALSMHMFGDADPSLAADMVGELANMTMGTLKTLFATEAVSFTGSVPEQLAADQFYQFAAQCQHQELFAFHSSGAAIVVRVGFASRNNRLVEPAGLREGMVLARPLYNARGVLLVAAGTRLSSTMVEQVRRSVQPGLNVEVASGGL